MLTVRNARPEMRAPYRTWLRANARLLVALCLLALALMLISLAGRRCEVASAGQWDCPMAGEGLFGLQFELDPDATDCEAVEPARCVVGIHRPEGLRVTRNP